MIEELLILTSFVGGTITGSSGVLLYIYYQKKQMKDQLDEMFDVEVDLE